MNDHTIVSVPWRQLLRELVTRFMRRGLSVSRTFDLQAARRSLRDADDVPCPHHGSGRCTCQYLVLRITRHGGGSSAVVVHGHDRVTKISVLTPASEDPYDGVAAEVRQEIAGLPVPDYFVRRGP